jgi:hypothetical protein
MADSPSLLATARQKQPASPCRRALFCGTAIVLLGRAFSENGLPFKTTQEAIADLSRSATGKPKKRNAKKAAG